MPDSDAPMPRELAEAIADAIADASAREAEAQTGVVELDRAPTHEELERLAKAGVTEIRLTEPPAEPFGTLEFVPEGDGVEESPGELKPNQRPCTFTRR